MAVIYGRRRIGKTTLINRFIDEAGCRTVSFAAVERTEKELLEMMSETVLEALSPELKGIIGFDSFDKLFDYLTTQAAKEKIIFFIDEYPYLARECRYMNSLIQKYVDYKWKNTEMYLILCGSMVSFMREEVLSESAPLHGRSTLEMRIRPFDYLETAGFCPEYSCEEKAILYGVTGGVAKYLEQFDPNLPLNENIIRQYFTSTGYFSEEQIKTVITGERSNPTIYSSTISAIAGGCTTYNEIATAVGISDITYCLKMLTKAEIIEKRTSKKSYYVIKDGTVRFWFRFAGRAQSLVNAGRGRDYFEREVKGRLHEYMGSIFEDICSQYILRKMGTGNIPFVTNLAEYQVGVKETGGVTQIEIDLLGRNGKDIALIGECKFRSHPFGREEYDILLNKVRLLKAEKATLVIFSLSGFDEYVSGQTNVIKVDISEMYATGT